MRELLVRAVPVSPRAVSPGAASARSASSPRSPDTTPRRAVAATAAGSQRQVQHQRQSAERWADERLTLASRADGTSTRTFRYEGTTCTQHGPGAALRLSRQARPARRRVIRSAQQACAPAPATTGTRFMCRYMNNAEHLMVAIDHEKPLLGQPLNDVLTWHAPGARRRLLLRAGSRKHKWGLVLETIHYALAKSDAARDLSRTDERTARSSTMKPVARSDQDTAAPRRRRHGHAAHDRRARAGQLRRRVEPHASRARARHPAPLRRGRLRLHPHQHVRRLAHHAQPPRQRRQRRRDQHGRRRDRPRRRSERPRRLRHRRHRPVRRADGAVRRVHRSIKSATRSPSRPRRSSTPAPTRSSSRRKRRSKSCCSASPPRSKRARRASSARWPTT